MPSNPSPNIDKNQIPPHTFLIVNGAQVYLLIRKAITIGRHTDNDIVVSDPHVSRHHIQLRATQGHFVLFDLGSTGGTSVNGNRVSQQVLQGGDIISLAGVPLIFGQGQIKDTPSYIGEISSEENLHESSTTLLVEEEKADSYLEMFDFDIKKKSEKG